MMHLKSTLALFDTSLNCLTAVGGMKPTTQVNQDIRLAVVEQRRPLHRVTGVVMEQCDIAWIGKIAIYPVVWCPVVMVAWLPGRILSFSAVTAALNLSRTVGKRPRV